MCIRQGFIYIPFRMGSGQCCCILFAVCPLLCGLPVHVKITLLFLLSTLPDTFFCSSLLGNLVKLHTAELEKPVPGKQDNSPSLKSTADEKRVASISRLREAFSLHPTKEIKSRGPETAELTRSFPSEKRGVLSSYPSDVISYREIGRAHV